MRTVCVLVCVFALFVLWWRAVASVPRYPSAYLPLSARTVDNGRDEPPVYYVTYGTTVYSTWTGGETHACNGISGKEFVVEVRPSSESALATSDAIVYYAQDYDRVRFQTMWPRWVWWPWQSSQVALYPEEAHPDQQRVLLSDESPEAFWHDQSAMSPFSLAMAMNPVKQNDGLTLPVNFGLAELLTSDFSSMPPMTNKGDQGGVVAWAASNCVATSGRLAYLQQLAKHVVVHSLGKCWNTYHTPNLKFGGLNTGAEQDGAEFEWMGKHYKFWFAAENRLCDSYMTEKTCTCACCFCSMCCALHEKAQKWPTQTKHNTSRVCLQVWGRPGDLRQ